MTYFKHRDLKWKHSKYAECNFFTCFRYGQQEEDRQWDSGGYYQSRDVYENRVNDRRSKYYRNYHSAGHHSEDEYMSTPGPRRRNRHTTSRSIEDYDYYESSDSTYPPPRAKHRHQLPPTPVQRHPPRIRHNSATVPGESVPVAPATYNEDYNYGYRSSTDALPEQDSLDDRYYSLDTDAPPQAPPTVSVTPASERRLQPRPLQRHQNDSLESREDDLRDSFETAASSLSSSHRRYDYMSGGSSGVDVAPPVSAASTNATSGLQNQRSISRDQAVPTPKGAVSVIPVAAVLPTAASTTVSSGTANSSATTTTAPQRGYLRPQDSLDSCAEEVALVTEHRNSSSGRDSPSGRYGSGRDSTQTVVGGRESVHSTMADRFASGRDSTQSILGERYPGSAQTSQDRYRETSNHYGSNRDSPSETALDRYGNGRESPVPIYPGSKETSPPTVRYGNGRQSPADTVADRYARDSPQSRYGVGRITPPATQLDRYGGGGRATPPSSHLDRYGGGRVSSPTAQLDRYGGGRMSPKPLDRYGGRISPPSTQLDRYEPPSSRYAAGRDSPASTHAQLDRYGGRLSPPGNQMDRYEPRKVTGTPPVPENSLIEPYVPTMSPPPTITLSRTPSEEPPPTETKSKSVSFEDEEQPPPEKPERRLMSARDRWHWAYNKIIMQFNVSTTHSHYSYLLKYFTTINQICNWSRSIVCIDAG